MTDTYDIERHFDGSCPSCGQDCHCVKCGEILPPHEIAWLKALRTRLHSENRMTGDDMRDYGHALDSIIKSLTGEH